MIESPVGFQEAVPGPAVSQHEGVPGQGRPLVPRRGRPSSHVEAVPRPSTRVSQARGAPSSHVEAVPRPTSRPSLVPGGECLVPRGGCLVPRGGWSPPPKIWRSRGPRWPSCLAGGALPRSDLICEAGRFGRPISELLLEVQGKRCQKSCVFDCFEKLK